MHPCNSFVLRSAIAATLLATFSATAAEDPIEQVIVTGSYIKGAVEDAALPVTVIDRSEIERQGSPGDPRCDSLAFAVAGNGR